MAPLQSEVELSHECLLDVIGLEGERKLLWGLQMLIQLGCHDKSNFDLMQFCIAFGGGGQTTTAKMAKTPPIYNFFFLLVRMTAPHTDT